MDDINPVHDLVHRLVRDRALRAAFEVDPASVLARFDLTASQRTLLSDGGFAALGEVGMHPLAQMVYALARTPSMGEQISVRDYLDDFD